MNRIDVMMIVLIGFLATGCETSETSDTQATRPSPAAFDDATYWDDEDDDGWEEEIPLEDVPDDVMDAALEALPGLVPSEAEREKEHGVIIYCIEGTVDGARYEVEVTADGEVVEVEAEDEEDDD